MDTRRAQGTDRDLYPCCSRGHGRASFERQSAVRPSVHGSSSAVPFIKLVFCFRLPVGFPGGAWHRECWAGSCWPGGLARLVGRTQLQNPRGPRPCQVGWCRSALSLQPLGLLTPVPPGAEKHPQPAGFAKTQTCTSCISQRLLAIGCLVSQVLKYCTRA